MINIEKENETKILPGFNIESLEKGIYASIHNYSFISNERNQRNEIIRNIILTAFSIFLSFFGLYQLSDAGPVNVTEETKTLLKKFVGYVLNHPIASILSLPAVLFVISVFFKLVDIYKFKITRGFTKLVLPLKRELAILTSFTITIILAYLTFKHGFGK